MKELKLNDEVYYTGDMANNDGFGIITNIVSDKWGTKITIKLDDDRIFTTSVSSFGEYKGTCNPRFTTKESYDNFRNNQMEILHKRLVEMGIK